MATRGEDTASWEFTNDGGVPVVVQLEPWGDHVSVPPGSKLIVRVTGCGGDPLEIRRAGSRIAVWATRSGCQIVAFLDGKRV